MNKFLKFLATGAGIVFVIGTAAATFVLWLANQTS